MFGSYRHCKNGHLSWYDLEVPGVSFDSLISVESTVSTIKVGFIPAPLSLALTLNIKGQDMGFHQPMAILDLKPALLIIQLTDNVKINYPN